MHYIPWLITGYTLSFCSIVAGIFLAKKHPFKILPENTTQAVVEATLVFMMAFSITFTTIGHSLQMGPIIYERYLESEKTFDINDKYPLKKSDELLKI